MRFTIFTPTFNRGYIIEALYVSLKKQTFSDFEWIVIDDGSTDNTEELFKKWLCEENGFSIQYHKVKNGGKHRAINKGVNFAKGELFFIVDSDDYLTEDALEIVDKMEKTIPIGDKISFCGVCGCKGYSKTEIVGNSFSNEREYVDATALERVKHGIKGDKAEVFYTECLKKYPFPEFENEKFITECVVWDKMANDGLKLRYFNKIIYLCDYLPDGLTKKGTLLFEQNPIGWGQYIYQSVIYGKIFGITKWETYWKYYNCCKKRLSILKIAKILHVSCLGLFIRMQGMRIFYRLYRN